MNPLQELHEHGQSMWLDYIRRSLISSGELKRYIEQDGLRGVTSNPSIFEKAISGSTDYKEALTRLQTQPDLNPKTIFERLAIPDIQDAADILRPVYDEAGRKDGYVSLEVAPALALDTQATLEEARRLWKAVDRENVMIKVPGTPQGIPAFQQLISEGINVNVTLLFSMQAWENVTEAYMSGLQSRSAGGGDLRGVASVASFFISRIDTAIDAVAPESLKGKVAIANAKLTYARWQELYASERWRRLASAGAQAQRLLWASTSTKNPKYRDVMYVEELIGPDTVNTIPPATFDAFRDHGLVRNSLTENVDDARRTMQSLESAGISMKEVTDKLLVEGVKLFSDSFDKLIEAVDRGCQPGPEAKTQTYSLPSDLAAAVEKSIADWQSDKKMRRLWARDASLWTGADEAGWLGWLGVTDEQQAHSSHLTSLAEEARSGRFTHVALLGMGGSSLCPEVMEMTFGKNDGYPELRVLDSTDPAQIRAFEAQLDLARTLFIVSSKSGSTLEPNIYMQYFYERSGRSGERFIAITDPGSKLQAAAEKNGFRHIYYGLPSIGGRYSALSDFGMVPSAAAGVDVMRFLDRAEDMVHACASCVPAAENPGMVLGAILGELAKKGRDKVTLIASPGIHDVGAWLEQLLAESTGKDGKGIIPADREPLGPPEVYGEDRLFAYLRLTSGGDASQDSAVDALEKAGHPVVRISVAEPYDLGKEFFRWEIATAVAGSIMGINAFNQPDVEASKIATRDLTSEYEKTGTLPPEQPILEDGGIKLFTDPRNAEAFTGAERTLAGHLRAHLNRLREGDYFAALAYIQMNTAHEDQLQTIRTLVRDRKRVATCLGFGPRFLHSTGQAYKGGPNSGVFLQITCEDAADLPVPGQKYTFGVVKAAQARGDFQVLADRGRRALRVHLGPDVPAGLRTLQAAVTQALR